MSACPLTEVEPLLEAVRRIRRAAETFHTNLFASREQISQWTERGALSWMDSGRCALMFRTGAGVEHVYHAAVSHGAISSTLALVDYGTHMDLAADLIGVAGETDAVVHAYEVAEFQEYATLFRMVRTDGVVIEDREEKGGATFAQMADVPAIQAFFLQLLDCFVDQIPEFEELARAVARENLLIVRCDEAIGGLLLFERSGLTTTLRYWYVNPALRDRGIGGCLMRTFFRVCHDARRIVLWVERSNLGSIAKYQYYGFRMERLMDRILIKRRKG